MTFAHSRSEPDVFLDSLARNVIEAAFEVHRVLGPGFLELTYEEALAIELAERSVPFKRQVAVPVYYKGIAIGQSRLDFFVASRLVIELKAQGTILPVHSAQVLSYLCAVDETLGLLINFNVPHLRQGIRRVVRTRQRP